MLARRSERHAPQHLPNCRQAGHQPVLRDAHNEERPAPQIVSSCAGPDHQRCYATEATSALHALLRRLNTRTTKQVFFKTRRTFAYPPPAASRTAAFGQRDGGVNFCPERLFVEREKFAQHLMVSAGVCWSGNGRLLFVEKKTKVNTDYYVGRLLPN